MAEDAARSGAQGDADPTPKGEVENADAGQTGEPDIEKIVAARVAQKMKSLGDLNELKRKAKAHDDLVESQKSETEKLQTRITELERKEQDWERERQSERLRSAVISEAAQLGFRDPSDAYRLLDAAGIEYEEDGSPKNLADQLKALLAQKPYLAGGRSNGSVDGGRLGQPVDKTPDMNALLRRAAKT